MFARCRCRHRRRLRRLRNEADPGCYAGRKPWAANRPGRRMLKHFPRDGGRSATSRAAVIPRARPSFEIARRRSSLDGSGRHEAAQSGFAREGGRHSIVSPLFLPHKKAWVRSSPIGRTQSSPRRDCVHGSPARAVPARLHLRNLEGVWRRFDGPRRCARVDCSGRAPRHRFVRRSHMTSRTRSE